MLRKIRRPESMILIGKNIDVFEKYYHKDVVMQENNQAPTIGKDFNRERKVQTMEMIEHFIDNEIDSIQ